MTRSLALLLGAVALLAGCASAPPSAPYASGEFSRQATCEAAGGFWHPAARVCELRRH